MTNQNKELKADPNEVLEFLCELSHQLLKWSWEGITGYETIVERVGQFYGHNDTYVYMEAQLANIRVGGISNFVKVGIPGLPPLAHTQDFENFLADIYEGKLTLPEARKALKAIQNKKPPYAPFIVWIGVILISAGFAVDIVGTWEGVIWASITAMATGIVFLAADRVAGFRKIAQLVATMASGLIVMIASKFGLTTAAPGLLLLGSTFVFLPGDSISIQAYEIAEGKWSAGVDRFYYSIMTLTLMVTGAFLAATITGTSMNDLFPGGPRDAFPWWAPYPGHVVLLLGIMFAFQMDYKQFLPALFVLEIVTAVAQVVTIMEGELAGTFVAMVVGTIMSFFMSRKPRSITAFVLLIPIILALAPGSHGLRLFETWISGEKITGIEDLSTLIGTLAAIAIGMVVGGIIARRWRWIMNFKKPMEH